VPVTPVTGTLPLAAQPQGAHAPARASANRARGLSTAAIVIAAIAALVALACAAWGLARMQAFEPHWALSARHSIAEAGHRMSCTWSEFSDWLRLGR
jgi:hypothetical protein